MGRVDLFSVINWTCFQLTKTHHPEIVTYPHHKHVGSADRLAPADQPSLKQVLAEIEGWLES